MVVTTIAVSKKNRNRLATFGAKDDKFEDIIVRLMDEYEEARK